MNKQLEFPGMPESKPGRPAGPAWRMCRVPIKYASAPKVRELIKLYEVTTQYVEQSSKSSPTSPRWERFREYHQNLSDQCPTLFPSSE